MSLLRFVDGLDDVGEAVGGLGGWTVGQTGGVGSVHIELGAEVV